MSVVYKDDQEDWLTVCLKYLLFVFNFLFWVSERCTCSPLFMLPTLLLFLTGKIFTVVTVCPQFTCIYLQCDALTALN